MNTTYDLNIRYNHWRFSNGRAVRAAYIVEPAGGIFVSCDAVRVGFAIVPLMTPLLRPRAVLFLLAGWSSAPSLFTFLLACLTETSCLISKPSLESKMGDDAKAALIEQYA